MTSCIKVKNLNNNIKCGCNMTTDDKYKFIHDRLNKQLPETVYVYTFSDGDNYFSVNDADQIVEPADPVLLKVFEHSYTPTTDEQRAKRITKNIKYLLQKDEIDKENRKEQFDGEKIEQFILKIKDDEHVKKELYTARDKYFLKKYQNNYQLNQEGGVLLWMLDNYMKKKYEGKTAYTVFSTVLEIIDIALLILSSIPGLAFAYGAGLVIDIIAIIYSFLRFDIIGMIGGVISLIPVIGDLAGGAIKAGGKIMKYLNKAKKVQKYYVKGQQYGVIPQGFISDPLYAQQEQLKEGLEEKYFTGLPVQSAQYAQPIQPIQQGLPPAYPTSPAYPTYPASPAYLRY